MHRSNSRWSRLVTPVALIAAGFTVLAPLPALSQSGVVDIDTVRAGRFDSGKMWTFEYSPAEYFSEEYGFDANEEWFERARMSALRIPGCSASFVSPHGLVATNHHCVRSRVSNVSRPGEDLLDNGFYATTLDEERLLPGMFADQLIAVRDITDEVAASGAEGNETREALSGIAENLRTEYLDRGDSIFVQTIGLYNGGRYSAYVFRRYTDVRLVAAAELQIGFFGGDPDNFTYPRYALDFAFLRVYGQDGRPFQTDHHFGWGSGGVEEGDAVFVIGSPGPTQRLTTMSQLEYKRDVQQPNTVTWLTTRLDALYNFWEEDPEAAR
ncbi:MAG: S46 family peptidase, partial [Gemmatimonadetes bacterium]|nr:S46 family peptidase [Gemmatimonadota bacterium]